MNKKRYLLGLKQDSLKLVLLSLFNYREYVHNKCVVSLPFRDETEDYEHYSQLEEQLSDLFTELHALSFSVDFDNRNSFIIQL